MSDATAEAEAPRKASKMPLILGLVLALAGGGGGYFAVSSGMLLSGGDGGQKAGETHGSDGHDTPAKDDGHATDAGHGDAHAGSGPVTLGEFAFVELPPLVISMIPGAQTTHLRFRATLEVPAQYAEEVSAMTPRVLDAMNGYLRALSASDIEARDALLVIRAQLTRRVQLVLGREKMRDLLVLEFVLT
ncbi:flagellar basal body protein FliL [Roseivivax halodurans JCM 10272]|uniref:Flagellar protein FliL n=1 Tax=Roseivivax halodurans JCM 10272 TaxID=1449350 RepID=X7EG14_9RHOB|nr:flagellar basal body-associated FliL family protein [Roseivivax halodurans]ETX15014.1 flagellar basal body protein FliL [Roseivivax halodurans JCM 10272]